MTVLSITILFCQDIAAQADEIPTAIYVRFHEESMLCLCSLFIFTCSMKEELNLQVWLSWVVLN